MKYLAALLLIFGFGLSGFGQTIKSLGYNTTNGQVVANTGTNVLTFTNNVSFYGGDVGTYASGFFAYGVFLNLEERKIQDNNTTNAPILNWDGGESITFGLPLNFNTTTNAATTRTNLGLGGGITATNTFVSYNGTNYTTNTVTISNGIITGWTQ